jgi:hypothetical protein
MMSRILQTFGGGEVACQGWSTASGCWGLGPRLSSVL